MSRWRIEDTKKLNGFTKPIVIRNGNTVVSVGIVEGERYYQYNPTTSKITGSLPYEESPHKILSNLSRYLNDIAYLIDEGQIYIKHVEPEPEVEKEHDNQISLF